MIGNNLFISQIMTYWSILISELDFKSISDLISLKNKEGFHLYIIFFYLKISV